MSSFEQHPSEFQPHPSEAEAKSLGNEGGLGSFQQSSLGSLSHSVRSKNLKSARVALIVAFIILMLQAGLEYVTIGMNADAFIKKETAHLPPAELAARAKNIQEMKEAIIRVTTLICLGIVGMAVVFLILAIFVKRFPLFCTVGGMTLYIGYCLIRGYLITIGNEQGGIFMAIFEGWLWKLIIIIGLVKGIKSAVAYHQEQELLQGNPV